MATRRIISGSRSTPPLMGRVWFNRNRVFNGFMFIFSNPRRFEASSGIIIPFLPRLYFNFFYFTLYFNINNNNNNN